MSEWSRVWQVAVLLSTLALTLVALKVVAFDWSASSMYFALLQTVLRNTPIDVQQSMRLPRIGIFMWALVCFNSSYMYSTSESR